MKLVTNWNLKLFIIWSVIGISFFALFLKLYGGMRIRSLLLTANKLIASEEIGVFQNDPVYGWAYKANTEGRHCFLPIFDVKYHIDPHGHRVSVGVDSLPKILLLGASFTFGHGVEDNEAYPSILQEKWPEHKVINAGVMGWGTGQTLLKLEEQLAVNNDIKIVTYGFISHHLERNYLRKSWHKFLQKDKHFNPYFEIVDGKLVHKGFADPDKDGIDDVERLNFMEKKITLLMIEKMKEMCESYSVPFVVIYLPDGSKGGFSREISSVLKDHFYDIREEIEFSKIRMMLDGHPNAEGHHLIAKSIEPIIEKFLLRNQLSQESQISSSKNKLQNSLH